MVAKLGHRTWEEKENEKDSFCGCSIPTVFNQRWIFLKRDQMKQEGEQASQVKEKENEYEHIWWVDSLLCLSPSHCERVLRAEKESSCERKGNEGGF